MRRSRLYERTNVRTRRLLNERLTTATLQHPRNVGSMFERILITRHQPFVFSFTSGKPYSFIPPHSSPSLPHPPRPPLLHLRCSQFSISLSLPPPHPQSPSSHQRRHFERRTSVIPEPGMPRKNVRHSSFVLLFSYSNGFLP